MASVTVSSNPSTTGNTLTVNFTTDATNITDVQITKDGSNYSSATTFTNTSAIFDVSSWSNGTYNNCYLKVIHSGGSSGGGTTSDVSGSFGALLKTSSTWYVIGDSISDTGLLPQRKYMTVLGEAFPNVTITNVGKDGSHFTNKTTGYSTFASLLDKLPSTAPDVVTVFGGVNDFIQSCSIGTISSTDTTNFYGAVKSFVSSIKTKYSSSKIIFILPLNMRAGAFSTNSDGTNNLGNTLQDYRDVINSVCTDNNIAVIDLHNDSELQPDLISSDGLHPNQDGHALLASKLRASIVGEASSGGGTGGGSTGGGETETYTTAVIGNFSTVGDCNGIAIDGSGNLTASTLGQWGMVKLDKFVSKLQFNVRDNQADHGALCWYIYNNNGDNTYNMIALGNMPNGENGKRFKMSIPGSYAQEIDKLDIPAINPGEQLTIEITDSAPTTKTYKDERTQETIITTEVITTQTIKRADGTTLTTLTGNMSGWCGQSSNSSPFCSNIQYVPEVVYDNPSYSVEDYKIILTQDGYREVFDANNFIYINYSKNKKEFVWEDGETYALALSLDGTGSKFRINGMYPSAGGYRVLTKNNSEEPYVLLEDAFIPTVNNFNFSVGVRNGDLENLHQVDTSFLNDCLYTFNCALPVLNYTIDSNSNNTIVLDTYNETWYGLSMTLTDRFATRLNKSTLVNDFGELNSSTESYKSWKSTLVHELGHSLGFQDNASHAPTLYSYNRNRAKVNYLQAPDIFTIKSLYKEKYNIDISKSQEDINSQVAALGLGTSSATDIPSNGILSVQFDYPTFTDNELYDKADLIIEGKLEFDRHENLNIGSENSPLILEYNIYKIIPNSVIKGEITNYELKIHVSEKINIETNNTYKLYLKQFENAPCSLINIEQGIQIKE